MDAVWPLNYMYCVLGLFMDYFEVHFPMGVSIRQYAAKLKVIDHEQAPKNCPWAPATKIPADYVRLIVKGLTEVRRTNSCRDGTGNGSVAVYYPAGDNKWESDLINPDLTEVGPVFQMVAQLTAAPAAAGGGAKKQRKKRNRRSVRGLSSNIKGQVK